MSSPRTGSGLRAVLRVTEPHHTDPGEKSSTVSDIETHPSDRLNVKKGLSLLKHLEEVKLQKYILCSLVMNEWSCSVKTIPPGGDNTPENIIKFYIVILRA